MRGTSPIVRDNGVQSSTRSESTSLSPVNGASTSRVGKDAITSTAAMSTRKILRCRARELLDKKTATKETIAPKRSNKTGGSSSHIAGTTATAPSAAATRSKKYKRPTDFVYVRRAIAMTTPPAKDGTAINPHRTKSDTMKRTVNSEYSRLRRTATSGNATRATAKRIIHVRSCIIVSAWSEVGAINAVYKPPAPVPSKARLIAKKLK